MKVLDVKYVVTLSDDLEYNYKVVQKEFNRSTAYLVQASTEEEAVDHIKHGRYRFTKFIGTLVWSN